MCRMFAYFGNSQEDLEKLYSILKKAAEKDPRLTWTKENSHGDGWGYVIVADNGIFEYKTHKAIFKDSGHRLPKVEGRMYAIFHSRKRSSNSPRAASIFSHPFFAATDDKLIFLSHNGSISTAKSETMVDSERVLKKIVKRGGLENAKEELEGMTHSALDLMVLSIDRASRGAKMQYMNYWKDNAKKPYYQLYTKKMKGGNAVFSSTLLDYGMDGEEVEFGKLKEL